MTASETIRTNRFSDSFGYPAGRAAVKVKDRLTPYVQGFIQQSPFAVMATCDKDGNCDASPKGGKQGFGRVLDEGHLLFPDVAGNNLFQSYQNLEANPHVGLIFFVPGINETVRVNGTASIVTKDDLEQRKVEVSLHDPDDRSRHQQGIIIEVEEAYGHCPRALKFSHLWDVEEIAANQTQRPVSER